MEKPSAPARVGFGRQPSHLRNVVDGRGFELGAAFSHHIDAQCAMRQLRAEIDVMRSAVQRVEIVAEAFPIPGQPLVQRGARDVLDALHELDQALVIARPHRRKADAAIAHHRGRDAVPARGHKTRLPYRLPVVMGVDVDEAGRDEKASRRDFLAAGAADGADLGDAAVRDRDVDLSQRRAGPVGERPAPDDKLIALSHVLAIS